eukprot:6190354-Pleurochrysis_carterae.AAC.1
MITHERRGEDSGKAASFWRSYELAIVERLEVLECLLQNARPPEKKDSSKVGKTPVSEKDDGDSMSEN